MLTTLEAADDDRVSDFAFRDDSNLAMRVVSPLVRTFILPSLLSAREAKVFSALPASNTGSSRCQSGLADVRCSTRPSLSRRVPPASVPGRSASLVHSLRTEAQRCLAKGISAPKGQGRHFVGTRFRWCCHCFLSSHELSPHVQGVVGVCPVEADHVGFSEASRVVADVSTCMGSAWTTYFFRGSFSNKPSGRLLPTPLLGFMGVSSGASLCFFRGGVIGGSASCCCYPCLARAYSAAA